MFRHEPVVIVTPQQVADLLEEIYMDGQRRCEADLWEFLAPLYEWVGELLTPPLPGDWRERVEAYLAEQEPKGYRIEPERRWVLFQWIEEQIEDLGLGEPEETFAAADEPHPVQQCFDTARSNASSDGRQTTHDLPDGGFVIHDEPDVSGPPAGGSGPADSEGNELAGPGPEVSESFKQKVQKALEVLDPKVAAWWRSNDVLGAIRARDAWFWQSGNDSYMTERGQPIVVVDKDFTAGQTAQAIISAVTSGGLFADSVAAFYKKYQTGKRLWNIEEFQNWQKESVVEAGQLSSTIAEWQVSGIATLSPAGELLVTIGDVAENGPHWTQLLSVLPLLGHLPLGAVIKVGRRNLKIPKALARKLKELDPAERKVRLKYAAEAKTDTEALDIIEHGIRGPEHHIATNKNWVSTLQGGPWSPVFERIFRKAGMTLDDVENKVRIPGHHGPHPEKYHREIFRRLTDVTKGRRAGQLADALLEELKKIAYEAQTPGTKLNRLLTQP